MTSRPTGSPPSSPLPRGNWVTGPGHKGGRGHSRGAGPGRPSPARPKKAAERDGAAIPLALPVILLVLARVDLGALSELLRAAAHLGCILHGGGKGGGALRRAAGTAPSSALRKMAAEQIRAPPAPPLYSRAGGQSAPLSLLAPQRPWRLPAGLQGAHAASGRRLGRSGRAPRRGAAQLPSPPASSLRALRRAPAALPPLPAAGPGARQGDGALWGDGEIRSEGLRVGAEGVQRRNPVREAPGRAFPGRVQLAQHSPPPASRRHRSHLLRSAAAGPGPAFRAAAGRSGRRAPRRAPRAAAMGVLPVPAEVRAILLDIEGTTTPIAFVQVRRGGQGGTSFPTRPGAPLAAVGAALASPLLS